MADWHSFHGQFRGHSTPHRVSRANATILPMEQAEDYESLSRVPMPACRSPVLCNFPEKYHLLEQIIIAAFTHLPSLERCVMTAMMPGGVRLPVRLLMEDIFLVHDLEEETQRLRHSGCCLLAIEERIIRHPLEAGDNTLRLRWFNAKAPTAGQGWTDFVHVLSTLNIVPMGGA